MGQKTRSEEPCSSKPADASGAGGEQVCIALVLAEGTPELQCKTT